MMKLDLDGNLLKRTASLESGKVNLNAGNLNATGKATICGLSIPNYGVSSDVTSSVFAASGTGYKPTKKGVLLIKVYNSLGVCDINIYNESGTAILSRRMNDAPAAYTSAGGTMELLIDASFSVRITANAGTAGTNYWAVFYPMKGN